MKHFDDNRTVSLDDLRESGLYGEQLLKDLEHGRYESLTGLEEELRLDKDYMEPILYAIKKEHNTYAVYTYFPESLQQDPTLAKEIVMNEPELLQGTPLSNNKQFIQNVALANPKIVQHMSQNLKKDTEFVTQLYELDDKEVLRSLVEDSDTRPTLLENEDARKDVAVQEMIVEQEEIATEAARLEAENAENTEKEAKEQEKETLVDDITTEIATGLEDLELEEIDDIIGDIDNPKETIPQETPMDYVTRDTENWEPIFEGITTKTELLAIVNSLNNELYMQVCEGRISPEQQTTMRESLYATLIKKVKDLELGEVTTEEIQSTVLSEHHTYEMLNSGKTIEEIRAYLGESELIKKYVYDEPENRSEMPEENFEDIANSFLNQIERMGVEAMKLITDEITDPATEIATLSREGEAGRTQEDGGERNG